MRVIRLRILLILSVVLLAGQALAAKAPNKRGAASQWLSIANEPSGRLELDKSRVGRSSNGDVQAWSRLTLDSEMPDSGGSGRYTAIEALNSYDCVGKRFTTLKRVYLRNGSILREERVPSPRAIDAGTHTVDATLLGEACKPRTFTQAKRMVESINLALESAKAGPMFADMRSEVGTNKLRALPVAAEAKDTKEKDAKEAKDKAASTAPASAAAASSSAAKRYIELPKVDKSQVEDPSKAAAAKAPAAKEEESKTKRGISTAERLAIEQQLAASGPRKPIKPKKKKVKPAAKEEATHGDTNKAHTHDIHWGYEGEGAPANWDKISPANATCATGKRQSPIDIREGIIRVELEPIKFEYQNAQFNVLDNGHTVQVNIGEGNSITIMGRTYQLVQFHFHRPSEERVNGHAYDMVAHFVHKDLDGKLAVVSVLFERGAVEHPVIQTVWNNLPLEVNQTVSPSAAIDLAKLLPVKRDYWTYMGSLTTPPCTEDVLWMVLKQPIQVTPEQIAIFSRLYKNNARPIQPANGRLIKESR